MSPTQRERCEQSEETCAYALQVLPASEVAAAEAHIASCPDCQRELDSLRPVVDRFVSWPTDVMRPTTSLQARLARRIADEAGKEPVLPSAPPWSEPDWEQVAPGLECKLLAIDTERHRVHARPPRARRELSDAAACGRRAPSLDGGSGWRAQALQATTTTAPGTADERIWSETGCARSPHGYQGHPPLEASGFFTAPFADHPASVVSVHALCTIAPRTRRTNPKSPRFRFRYTDSHSPRT
jgi:hypothetical protein